MIFILFVSLYCSLYGFDTFNVSELSEETLAILVSGETEYFNDTGACIDRYGQEVCARLQSLSFFEAETIRHCKAYMDEAKGKWHSRWPSAPLPFCADIERLSQSFDQYFLHIELPLWKSVYKGFLFLMACDYMSCTLDHTIKDSERQYFLERADIFSIEKEDQWQDMLRNLKSHHSRMIARALPNWFLPDFMQTRIGGLEVKYEYTENACFSLLEFIACCKQGVLLLKVQKPHKAAHHVRVHEYLFQGSGNIFFHDCGHLGVMTTHFRVLEEGFKRSHSDKANHQVFIDILCDYMSKLPNDREKAKGLVTFFCLVHENDATYKFCDKGEHAAEVSWNFSLGLFDDKDIFTKLVFPLCNTKEKEKLATIPLKDNQKSDAYYQELRSILQCWYNQHMADLEPQFAIFQSKKREGPILEPQYHKLP